jgi:uncharacterized protein
MLFFTAFITGVLGSFHCAGMCGPIAFALPTKKAGDANFYVGRFIYNLGRIITYATLGILMGLFGSGLKLAGIQQGLSIAAGVFILFWALYQLLGFRFIKFQPLSWLGKTYFSKLMGNASSWSLLGIGLLNGLLPCGFVYLALVGSSVTQHVWDAAIFMALFGLGTLPMMYGVSVVGQFLSQKVRSNLTRLSPIFAILIAALFIVRGLNLGIPYVSPQINNSAVESAECH